jgi:transcriptional regulator with XRE-family HTH domain
MAKTEAPRSPWDQNFARNFKQLREDMGMTQDEIVTRMAHFGFSFHQATVYKIEKGERKVGLGEAMALASCLDTSIEALTHEGILATDDYYSSTLWQLADNMLSKLTQIWELTDTYNDQRSKMLAVLSRLLESDGGNPREFARVFGDDAAFMRSRLRDEFVPVLTSRVVTEIRNLLLAETEGALADPFTNITGLAEFSAWPAKPADPIVKALDDGAEGLLKKWEL